MIGAKKHHKKRCFVKEVSGVGVLLVCQNFSPRGWMVKHGRGLSSLGVFFFKFVANDLWLISCGVLLGGLFEKAH